MPTRPNIWYQVAYWPARIALGLLSSPHYRGGEHLQKPGGLIVAANHVSHADPFVLAMFVHRYGRPARFLAKAELFTVPVVGRILRGACQIPVYRNTEDASLALRDAVAALRAGHAVMIYPEGTITKDPELWPMGARTGVARLALESGAPVVPVAQWGPQRIGQRFRRRRPPLRVRVDVVAGPPIDLSHHADGEPTTAQLRAATAEVMTAIRAQVAELRGEPAPLTDYDPEGRHLHAVRDSRQSA